MDWPLVKRDVISVVGGILSGALASVARGRSPNRGARLSVAGPNYPFVFTAWISDQHTVCLDRQPFYHRLWFNIFYINRERAFLMAVFIDLE
ncbi:MAG TPA: hypothetical protein PKD23_10705 [Bellilinea sp.]|nr:hypothetical protein [Bellilinea sp.]